ncbi:nuclear transport factor 2 family protein [Jidongwangia harbinensis]|uniref:nuclear transport factor 2 family protein n=1 Tax=Jidongwangia harbinensis TaxID=2878561 RepID=UPI001CDA28BB|nr:nuclear transport factor 2 family protein [Jidongwangia harbinensis]MCA2216564.1 nuclear transport factor 2 family protein [Jidongwangia harbinensis]
MNDAVTASIVRFFRAVDTRDWATVRALLADEVVLDYVSLFGGEVETVAADEVVERWRALLPGFDATQHFLGVPAELDGTVQANVRGYHVLGDEVWMVAGWYRLTLTAGDPARVAGIVLTAAYETGDRELVARARERAAGWGVFRSGGRSTP